MLLVVALARPQWLDTDPAGGTPGHNLVFVIDVSGSMRTLDYVSGGKLISRLEMLKGSLNRFLQQARQLRVGIVIFADDAMTFMPLTSDLTVAAQMVTEIDNSLAGEKTALGDALALSIRRMQAVHEQNSARILVLLTDGVPTSGTVTPEGAAALARSAGIRIYAAGIGSNDPAMFPLSPTEQPMIAAVPLDEQLLRGLASSTGGAYYRIAETADLERILIDIEQVEKTRIPAPVAVRDWYWLPALAGLIALVAAERRGYRWRTAA